MTPAKGVLVRGLAYSWVRGPAVRDRDQIVIENRHAEIYEPLTLTDNVGIALARVRTPDEAVTFATAFGLLTAGPGTPGFPLPAVLSQSWADFEREATSLRRIFRTTIDVRNAQAGDAAALARLRDRFARPDGDEDDDRSLLIRANAWAALGLNNKLLRVRAYVFEPTHLFTSTQPPGELRLGLVGPTLLDYCAITFAHALATEPVVFCEECQRPFVRADTRQRFCEPACANRARFRRFKTKPAPTRAPTSSRTRRRHEKTTKKR